ncbi:Chitin-binding domain protein cbd-1 [Acropora cervicornis]|uniref:Chitin-binding domain protein cbd-1 n=1 Tax=Acropora cervicornis TaxID=6130 RepID=A0AAD9USY3_ACRCE|nr:Chitin-binding domain protein cbd-1 [Acropora cervicornis]
MVFGKICVGLVLSVVIFEFAEQVKGRFCDGKRDGDYTNPSNCYGFIACSGGIAYDMPCPAGLKFDEKKDACDYNAPCYQEFCKNKSDGDYADPNNRYGFITCSGGLTYYRNCPANLRFNQTLDECVWALI